MPIYEQAYRKYEAREALRQVRFWPITREALRLILAKRAFLGLLVLAWLPFIGFLIYIWALTQFGQAAEGMTSALPKGGAVFAQFFKWQMLLGLLLTTFGGAGLVANDLRTGAILVYLSRPLTRRDYVIGKLCVLLAINLFITLVPGLLLYAVAIALAPAQFLKWELAWLGTGGGPARDRPVLSLSLPALAVSSLSRSARVAGLAFFGLLMGLDIVSGIVGAIGRWPATILFSIQACVNAVGDALLGRARDHAAHGCTPRWSWRRWAWDRLLVLRSRVRAVEIVR